ncbi:MAG TPA: hypothetical protein GX405_15810 [Rhizobiales bacterium]|nr:hypothetical protein [Hyphomicrobiales bacterium]
MKSRTGSLRSGPAARAGALALALVRSDGILRRSSIASVAALVLAGCAHSGNPGGACCDGAERYPGWLIKAYEPVAPVLGEAFGRVVMRRGLLVEKPDALRHIAKRLRPLDILVVSSKGRLTGTLIPGLFSHTVVYVGSEAELKALGAWNDPAVRPHHADIRAGKVMIESDHRGVHLTTTATALDTDRVVILRPRATGSGHRAAARLLAHVGTPYDFYFDNSDAAELYCAELVDHVMPEVGLPSRELYGRRMFLPDDAIDAATSGRMRATPVLYVRATDAAWEDAGAAELKRDLAAAWRR